MAIRKFTMRALLATVAACVVISAGAARVPIDNAGQGNELLNSGPTPDTLQGGSTKLKSWASSINAMTTELYAVTTGSAYYIKNCPGVALNGTTDDAPAINACIAAQPAGTTFYFPSGVTIGLKSALTDFKAKQRLIGNGVTLKAIIVGSTITAGFPMANGATSVRVTSRTGFTCGQAIKIGSRAGTAMITGLVNEQVITGTSGAGNCTPATGEGSLYFGVGITACNVSEAGGGGCDSAASTIAAGSRVVSAGQLIKDFDETSDDLEITGFNLDGSRNADVTQSIPRWEADNAIHLSNADRYYVHDITLYDTDGDGVALNGEHSRALNITGRNIGGNLIHWADGYYQQTSHILGVDINVAGILMGHQDGMVTFSNKCNYGNLSNLTAVRALRVFGGADAYGGTHLSVTGMVGVDLSNGPFYLFNAGTGFTGTTTSGSAVVSSITSTRGLFRGFKVTASSAIPANTFIQSVDSATQITLSNNASLTGARTIDITGGESDVVIANSTFDNSEFATPGLLKIQGLNADGGRSYNIRLSNIVAKNTSAWISNSTNLHVSMRLDNEGRELTGSLIPGGGNMSILLADVQNSMFDLDITGGHAGIHVSGANTRNLTLTGQVKNQQGTASNARGIYVASDVPDEPQVHIKNMYIAQEAGPGTAWAATTAYTLGQIRYNGSNNYIVRTAGTSAGSGGPTGVTSRITDGTVVWGFLNTPPRFPAVPGTTSDNAGMLLYGGTTVEDSEFDITTGDRTLYANSQNTNAIFEISRNVFRHISGYDSGCCIPLQFVESKRLVFKDNIFPGYDTAAITTNVLRFSGTAPNGASDGTVTGNVFLQNPGSADSIMRFNNDTNRMIVTGNVFPYIASGVATYSTPGVNATTGTAIPVFFTGTSTNDLVMNNSMRQAASP